MKAGDKNMKQAEEEDDQAEVVTDRITQELKASICCLHGASVCMYTLYICVCPRMQYQ